MYGHQVNGDGYDDSVFIHNPTQGTTFSASRYNPNDRNDNPLYCRSYQFANFIYFALNSEQKLGLHYTPTQDNSEDLNVLVDQANCTYTVGPYTVSFDNQSNTGINGWNNSMATLVRQEILGANLGENEENQFCTGKITTNIIYDNGTTRENVSVDILDENGRIINPNDKGIVFPEFGKEFYIRYNASIDEDLIKKIEPSIQINYARKLTGSFWTYRSKTVEYYMIEDQGGILQDVVEDESLDPVKVDENGDVSWVCKALSPTQLTTEGGVMTFNQTVEEWVSSIKTKIVEELKERGSGWGLDISDDGINIGIIPGIYYEERFYSVGTFGDPESIEMPYITYRTEAVAYGEPQFQCQTCGQIFNSRAACIAHASTSMPMHNLNPIEVYNHYYMATGHIVNGFGSMVGRNFEAYSYNSEIEARRNLVAVINEEIKMYLAIKITGLKITETIENIQPNVQLEVPPWTTTTWRRIEITEERNGYGYKVEGSGAAERVTLPSPDGERRTKI